MNAQLAIDIVVMGARRDTPVNRRSGAVASYFLAQK